MFGCSRVRFGESRPPSPGPAPTRARAAVRRPARPGLDIAAAVLAVVVVVRLTRMRERKVRSDELPTPAHG
ncbi:hypothetical protein ACIGXF_08070 [Streptomyces sp. NPDC053086]|uniref:hypothetical protein n=1 Tax=unclassified Streptomyces TaxID=2593676 RepID=UPI0037D57830